MPEWGPLAKDLEVAATLMNRAVNSISSDEEEEDSDNSDEFEEYDDELDAGLTEALDAMRITYDTDENSDEM
jgi:hypothetical protein